MNQRIEVEKSSAPHGNPTCATCRWWVQEGSNDPDKGTCFGAPPTAHPAQSRNLLGQVVQTVMGFWPVTGRNHFCGAHRPLPIMIDRQAAN